MTKRAYQIGGLTLLCCFMAFLYWLIIGFSTEVRSLNQDDFRRTVSYRLSGLFPNHGKRITLTLDTSQCHHLKGRTVFDSYWRDKVLVIDFISPFSTSQDIWLKVYHMDTHPIALKVVSNGDTLSPLEHLTDLGYNSTHVNSYNFGHLIKGKYEVLCEIDEHDALSGQFVVVASRPVELTVDSLYTTKDFSTLHLFNNSATALSTGFYFTRLPLIVYIRSHKRNEWGPLTPIDDFRGCGTGLIVLTLPAFNSSSFPISNALIDHSWTMYQFSLPDSLFDTERVHLHEIQDTFFNTFGDSVEVQLSLSAWEFAWSPYEDHEIWATPRRFSTQALWQGWINE